MVPCRGANGRDANASGTCLKDRPAQTVRVRSRPRLGGLAPNSPSVSVHRITSTDSPWPLLQLLLLCFLGAPVHFRPWGGVHVLIVELGAPRAPGLSQPGSKGSLEQHTPPFWAASPYSRPCNLGSPKDDMLP